MVVPMVPPTDRTQPIHAVTKQEIESYLAQYSAQNFINHRAALSNLFGYAFKIGATPENPLLTIEKPREPGGRNGQLGSDRPHLGVGLVWEELDFHLSVEGMLAGKREFRS